MAFSPAFFSAASARTWRCTCSPAACAGASLLWSLKPRPDPVRPAFSSRLRRVDQEFLAGGALGIEREVGEIERLRQRHDLGVVAGEGGLEFAGNALAQLLSLLRSDLHQERKQQPAADAPGRAERAVQFDRARVERAVDINLLVHVRAVAAVDPGVAGDRSLHAGQDLSGELATADR